MRTEILSARDPRILTYALEILTGGGLVAFPTDTVYGLGALAFDDNAVKRIYAAKGRSTEKAIPILLSDSGDLDKVALHVSEMALKLAACFWPGPLTLVVLKHPSVPQSVSSTAGIGVRVPDLPVARSLLQLVGPMAVTSANLSGQASPSTAEEVLAQLGGRIALILDGGRTPGGIPSTVVDCISPEPQIIRQGPIPEDEIQAILGRNL
jgi:L-threonylcarbamoyladenylate synthase